MAVGDVVNVIGGAGANLAYQPAGSNEVMISWMGDEGTHYLYDGVNTCYNSYFQNQAGGTGFARTMGVPAMKMFLTNAVYCRLNTLGARQGISGIQIK
jgi:hypothetical protein